MNAKSDVLTAFPGAMARWDFDAGLGIGQWIIRRSDADVVALGTGSTEAEAWSDALRRIIEKSALRR